jgi:hypothetical protein
MGLWFATLRRLATNSSARWPRRPPAAQLDRLSRSMLDFAALMAMAQKQTWRW